MNDSSRPTDNDLLDHLPQDKIDHTINRENFISIDPYLGISEKIKEIPGSGRGAGHIIMDANNLEHWQQLANFLKQNNIKIHQIIITAGMEYPEKLIEFQPQIIKIQLGILEPSGQIVNPYFSYYTKTLSTSFKAFKDLINPKFIRARGNPWTLAFNIENNGIVELFRTKKYVRIGTINTQFAPFLKLVEEYHNGQDISQDLKNLIEDKIPSYNDVHKDFVANLSLYFISIFDINKFLGKDKESLTPETIYLKESELQQMKVIIPIYKTYFSGLGYNVQLVTNQTVAQILNIPEIEVQSWGNGDYPYGERNHIALILSQ
jgi:hypothetical protein